MFLFIYILVGILLGPSFAKASIPDWIFSLSSFGFLFIAGFELDLRRVKKHLGASTKLALGAFVLPFVVGLLFAYYGLGRTGIQQLTVIALALAISALPVVVQILKDLKIYGTPTGNLVLAAATLCDLAAWVLFTLVIPSEARSSWLLSHLPVAFFFLGIFVASALKPAESWVSVAMSFNKFLFGPIFFIGVGMKIHWQENFLWGQFLALLLLACVSKMVGVYGTAKVMGYTPKESSLMAFVLNARGAMEILFCSIALKLGLIDEVLFTSLTLMAVLSSVMASPLVKIFVSGRKRP